MEKKYVDIPVSEMFPLLIIGNFLEIKGLIDLICKAVALQTQDNNVQEIREKFQRRRSKLVCRGIAKAQR